MDVLKSPKIWTCVTTFFVASLIDDHIEFNFAQLFVPSPNVSLKQLFLDSSK